MHQLQECIILIYERVRYRHQEKDFFTIEKLSMDTITLVLWAHHFDEQMATVFVTEFRRAGKPVKLVGMRSGPTIGAHGLILTPDLTLGQALPLMHTVANVIIPCDEAGLHQFDYEPRLSDLFHEIQLHRALLVLGWIPRQLNNPQNPLYGITDFISVLSEREDLINFVRSNIHQFVRHSTLLASHQEKSLYN